MGLSPAQEGIFEDCLKRFNIKTVSLSSQPVLALQKEKFEGLVLPINENAGDILKAARTSTSNKRLMIFGLCQQVKDILPYALYGINVTLEEPLDHTSVLKAVNATHLLILNEFRRYLRVPVVLPVHSRENPESVLAPVSTCARPFDFARGGSTAVRKNVSLPFTA